MLPYNTPDGSSRILPQYDFNSARSYAMSHQMLGEAFRGMYPTLNAYYDHTMVRTCERRLDVEKGSALQ